MQGREDRRGRAEVPAYGLAAAAIDQDAPGRDREAVIATIRTLRENGLSFSAIAARLEENGIPTFSGKGQWRGQTVHKLFKQRAE